MARRSSRRTRTFSLIAGLVCAAAALSGCSFDIGGIVEDQIEGFIAEQGLDGDITFGSGPSCLPDWVTHPEEEAANQGLIAAGGEVCISAWPQISSDVDVAQQLPAALDDSDIAMLVQMLLPMMTGQMPGGFGGQVEGQLGEVGDQLDAMGMDFTAYGDNDRLLLVLSGTGDADPGMMSLSMGVFCAVSC